MTSINGKSKILTIIEDINVNQLVKFSLKDVDDFQIIEHSTVEEGIQSAIAKLQPNIVLLDFDVKKEHTYTIIDNIAATFPEVAVVVILQESEANVSDRVVLSGARAFLLFPFTKEKLLTTLRRLVELAKRNSPGSSSKELSAALPEKAKNTFTVFSPKGGTGCTTIAINLAIALRNLREEPVLLMEGKLMFGHIALMLNIRSTNSITDLISHAGMLDTQLIKQVVVEHASGINVLLSPMSATGAQGIHADDLYKVITELQATYPVMIIDGGNYLHENTVTIMDASDKIIVVVNPNLASIRDVRQFFNICQELAYPKEKIMLVLNNSGHKTDIRHDEIEKILMQKITCEIQADDKLFLSSLNEGIPAIIKNPRHPANKAIKKLAVEISNEITKKNTSL
jgi:pilus assembly protein CpaE